MKTRSRPAIDYAEEGAGPLPRNQVGRTVSLGALFTLPSVIFVVVVLLLPLVALLWRTVESGVFFRSIWQPLVWQALRLTIWSSLVTVLLSIGLGTPLAYGLARAHFPGKRLVDTLVDLPIVLPPVVAGVGLLMAFGRRGLVGQYIQEGLTLPLIGLRLPAITLAFSTTAVILAQLFVSAPFFIRAARAAFATTERDIEDAAAIDGATPWQIFRLVTVPLALPALSSGLILCWARAVGEFGATMMFAGNFSGRTQTMPLAIMVAMESDLYAALALSVLLVVLSFGALFVYRLLGARQGVAI